MKLAIVLLAAAGACAAQISIKPAATTVAAPAAPTIPTAGKGPVSRAAIAQLEGGFEGRIDSLDSSNLFQRLGSVTGVYLSDYGVVFTVPLDLINTPRRTPFDDPRTPERKARIHTQKVAHLALLKTAMQEFLKSAAGSLNTLPAGQKITVAAVIFYYDWEDRAGLPGQVVMTADRESAKAGKIASEEQ